MSPEEVEAARIALQNDPERQARLQALMMKIARVLERDIAPLFKDDVQITLICRVPGLPERDVLVTTESQEDLAIEVPAALERAKGREVIR